MPTQILAPGTEPAVTADITVTDASEVSVGIYSAESGPIPYFSGGVFLNVKNPAGGYLPIMELTPYRPRVALRSSFGPGVYQISRGKLNKEIGAMIDPDGQQGGGS